jgi:hypothetical protein
MDQIKIESLEREVEKLKLDLEKSQRKKDELFKISIEYKKICEEEIEKSQLLIQEIDRLNVALLRKDSKIARNEEFSQGSSKRLENLMKIMKVYREKFENHQVFEQVFDEELMKKKLLWTDLDKIIIKLLKIVDEWVPVVTHSNHKKTCSYDENANNPLFAKLKPKIIIKRPPSLAEISRDIQENVKNSKEIIKSCITSLESGCLSTRSNPSSNSSMTKGKVRVYRREKSTSQLV